MFAKYAFLARACVCDKITATLLSTAVNLSLCLSDRASLKNHKSCKKHLISTRANRLTQKYGIKA